MKRQIIFIAFVLLMPFITSAQKECEATTLDEFFECYGGRSSFSIHSIKALTAFIEAEDAIDAGKYDEAKVILDKLFNEYPQGSNLWWSLFNSPQGANIGAPHAYYGLRMMEDIIAHGLNQNPNTTPKTVNMKVILVGCSQGIQPTNKLDLQNGTGVFVNNRIQPKLFEDNYRVIRQSINLFIKYVSAITYGGINVDIQFVELDTVCVPVKVTKTRPYFAYDNFEPVWPNLSNIEQDTTDWYMLLYPSHVPEGPDFDKESFITGGMGTDRKSGPLFIADDKWIVRKPAHLGNGNYTDIERRIYLPQWYQHEFFHHLYRIYPELQLEVLGHDWFNRSFWPASFKGQFEADYYAESLRQKLQTDCAPLVNKLITRIQSDKNSEFTKLAQDEFLGTYALKNITNNWHEAEITSQGEKYFWKNKANVMWQVTPDLMEGNLVTGSDCPYPGENFYIELYQSIDGTHYPSVLGLKFNNEIYYKKTDLIRTKAPIEIALATYERVPNYALNHSGEILKSNGNFSWRNKLGESWKLLQNIEDEKFLHSIDSPTPSEDFQLILTEDDCDIHVLGFEYQGYYYWKPKRSYKNTSPYLLDSIADLQLKTDFVSYSVNLDNTFHDFEGDPLYYFVTSEQPNIIEATILQNSLVLKGSTEGKTVIYVMAIDPNGGLSVDSFVVVVKNGISALINDQDAKRLEFFPTITQDIIHIKNLRSDNILRLHSVNNVVMENINFTGDNTTLDLSHLPKGVYLLSVKSSITNEHIIKKILKI